MLRGMPGAGGLGGPWDKLMSKFYRHQQQQHHQQQQGSASGSKDSRRHRQSANPAGVAKETPTPTPNREQAAGGGGCSQSTGLFLINQAAPHPDIESSNDDRSVPQSSSGCLKSRQTSPDSSIADPGSKHTIE